MDDWMKQIDAILHQLTRIADSLENLDLTDIGVTINNSLEELTDAD